MERKNSMLDNFADKLRKGGVEKSDDELARTRLQRELGDSGWIMGAVWCGIVAVWSALLSAVGESTSIKIKSCIVLVISIALLIFCVIKYIKRKNALEDVFESILAGERSIRNISVTSGLNEREVIRVVQSLLSKGIIKNVYIDKLNHKIVEKQKNADESGNIDKVVLCSGCGAKNTLNGTVGQQCEYCGAVLHED